MLSVIVVLASGTGPSPAPALPLLRTLSSLVSATVDGVVRDVTLLQTGENVDAAAIADEAGCALVHEPDFATALERAVGAAKSSWILLLRAGAVPGRAFGEEIAAALDESGKVPGNLILRERRGGPGRWWRAFAPVAGVIAPRERLSDRRCRSFADAVRRAGRGRDLPSAVPVLR